MRRIAVLVVSVLCLVVSLSFAEENAQERAEEIHKIASSDAIFVEEELKALYYQNVQMIELLREIRDLLEMQVVDNGEEG